MSEIDFSGMDTEALKGLRAKIDAILDGPADKADNLDSAIKAMQDMKAKVAEIGKRAVSKAIAGLLGKHPEVASVRWTQYTPYFNDGDSCEFSVHDPEVRFASEATHEEGSVGEDDEDEEDYIDSWSLGYYAERRGVAEPKALMESLRSLGNLFSESEDAMRATFGDHVQVTIGRDGKAEVEEYGHD